jgi:RNA polymerase sigma factor (sigma-70 family)
MQLEQKANISPGSAEERNDSILKIIRKEQGRLRNYIRKRVSSSEDADDILQDVFYQFVSIMQLDNIEKAASWLFRVAGNRITDWYRKRKPVSLDSLKKASEEGDLFVPLDLEELLFDPEEDPEKLYLRSSVWPLLSDALQELNPEQREVFLMHELDDLSFKEIAEITGIPLNTLVSRKRYAILFLREKLQDLYNEFFYE